MRYEEYEKKKRMKNKSGFSWGASMLLFVLWGCNPAKNTAINRAYHSTTAQYNGYFNANLLLDQSLSDYRKNLKEDYYTVLPLQQFPDTASVKNLYPAIDTAIAKCTKVIQEHSMPGSTKPSAKKEENNTFIDENWITIGKASYLRMDYEAAMKNFQFVKKFYQNDPSNYVGELWMAKTNLALNKTTDAGFNLDNLDRVLEEESTKKKEQSIKKIIAQLKKSKKAKAKEKEEEPAPFPKKILPEFYLTKAQYHLVRQEKDKAMLNLDLAAKSTRKKSDKARLFFILGQMNEELGNTNLAVDQYSKVLKSNAPFEMAFSARLKRAFLSGDDRLIKELNKMLKDAKNAEFKDQIYYSLANIELQKGNEETAKQYLTESAFYSTTNTRQKGMAYEKLGDLAYAKRAYIPSQKYYDSCAKVINDQYPNAVGIRNKAAKLSDLVQAVETAQYEDSVQRIANLNEEDQAKFLKNVGKVLKEREDERKLREKEKLLALQKNENINQSEAGNKTYWGNVKTRAKGYDEFRKQWGTRENSDDWRRSEKIVIANAINEDGTPPSLDSLPQDTKVDDPFALDVLAKGIPKGDSAINASQQRLVKALYTAGLIYKDQLNEPVLATQQFSSVIDRTFETDYKLMSAFQLYQINKNTDVNTAETNKNYILNYYPNSDYANYLRDPDYFVKKKDKDAQTQKDYLNALNRYQQGLYYPALMQAETVLSDEPKNEYRAKYMLLKAMCQGKLNEEKSTLIPTLNQLIKEFPSSSESTRAQELLDIIKNGYSKNEPADFSKKKLYSFNDEEKHYVMIFLSKDDNSNLSKTRVIDFNKEFYSRANLKVTSKIYGDDQSIIVVDIFDNDLVAKEYMRTFKATRKYLLDLQNAKTLLITQENLKTLFQTQKLKEYEEFCEEYY